MKGRLAGGRLGGVFFAIFFFFLLTGHCRAEDFGPPGLPTFGSQALLESCWSSAELLGSANDRIVHRPVASFLPPPFGLPTPAVPLEKALRGSIRSVRPAGGKKVVALTFDLCERENEVAGYDAAIINFLRKNHVEATFFAGGKWMQSHPVKAKQLMADPLFEIGNHAWTHGNLRVLKGQAMAEQVQLAQREYEILRTELAASPCARRVGQAEVARVPTELRAFRFPYGTCSREALTFLANQGLPAIQWDVVTADPAPKRTADGIVRTVLTGVHPGSIIICHANGRGHGTAEALPRFVRQLRAAGYRFVTISELLRMGKVVAVGECYECRAGDNLQYDRLFGAGTR